MPYAEFFDAIILKTYDLGEGDRLCILFTRERGKLAARAKGACKPTSRLGSHLLPFKHVHLELKEHGAMWIISGVRSTEETSSPSSLKKFTVASQGTELLLALLQDDEPLPNLFDATRDFFAHCEDEPHALLHFTIQILHILGHLPSREDLPYAEGLDGDEQAFLKASLHIGKEIPPLPKSQRVQKVMDALLRDLLQRPLRAGKVAASLEL